MRWQDRRRSSNVEDRRGQRAGFGTGRVPMPMVGGGVGLGGLILILVISLLMGGNPLDIFTGGTPRQEQGFQIGKDSTYAGSASEEERKEFLSVVLAETEDYWSEEFQRLGRRYQPATLVLFTDSVQSGCGFASAQVGPFYCSADSTVYIDMRFFDELAQQYGAQGDFAIAYVLAHEIGHHVQNLVGITRQVAELRQRVSEREANELSVRMELQADYFAGAWANYAQKQNILEPGDLEEAINAASRIGDDVIQERTTGTVRPDTFTHGTAAQRARWFKRGLQYGTFEDGDTFNTNDLKIIPLPLVSAAGKTPRQLSASAGYVPLRTASISA